MVVEIDSLRKSFGGRRILDGISFRAMRGETIVLMGPSGSGKTTLLRCMNGLERAEEGVIRVVGEELRPGHPDGGHERRLLAIRRRVGFVFQQWHLFANLTVLENVIEAPVHVARVSRGVAMARALTLLDRVGIGHRAAAYPDQLSGGEQQRAAIARALAMDPEVLLLDEPTSALDAARVDELLDLLRGLAAPESGGGLTIIAVTHDQRVAAALGRRVVLLAEGRITQDSGPPAGDATAPDRSPPQRSNI